MGFFLYSSPRLYLAIRCWQGRVPFHSGHMHNDQLSVELVMDGEEIIRDFGTFLYTPIPEVRNLYRSAKAHFTPCIRANEAESFKSGLFRLPNPRKCETVIFTKCTFLATLSDRPACHRLIKLFPDKIEIVDYGKASCCGHKREHVKLQYSPGYGQRFKDRCKG
jgi:hypothetical protein